MSDELPCSGNATFHIRFLLLSILFQHLSLTILQRTCEVSYLCFIYKTDDIFNKYPILDTASDNIIVL